MGGDKTYQVAEGNTAKTEGDVWDEASYWLALAKSGDQAVEPVDVTKARIASLERRIDRKNRRIDRLTRDVQNLANRAARAEEGYHALREAAMQAIVAALLWGESGIDVAASARIASDVRDNLLDDPMTIYVGAQQTVTLGLAAADLLSEAGREKNLRGIGSAGPHSTWRYDLTDAQPSRTIGFGLGKGA